MFTLLTVLPPLVDSVAHFKSCPGLVSPRSIALKNNHISYHTRFYWWGLGLELLTREQDTSKITRYSEVVQGGRYTAGISMLLIFCKDSEWINVNEQKPL